MKPGIYQGISNEKYHSAEMSHIISNSYLGRLSTVPAAAKVPQEDTGTFQFGRAFHAFVLEPNVFYKTYFIAENRGKQKKEDKEYWLQIAQEQSDKEIIKLEDFETIQEMDKSIKGHPFASELMKKGVSEQTIIWQDEETGLLCKVRPDRTPAGEKGVILDLKKTRDAGEHSFQSSCVKYGYARAAAMYMEGYSKATGILYADLIFTLIAVEDTPPYRIEVYPMSTDFIQYGWTEMHRLLRIEYKCRKNNHWPNYQNAGAQELQKPGYLGAWELGDFAV